MSKSLEALEQLSKLVFVHGGVEQYRLIEKELKDYENLKLKHRSMQDAVLEDFKKLKALEIIREKAYIEMLDNSNGIKGYGVYILSTHLTKEEYDLLKEVLM